MKRSTYLIFGLIFLALSCGEGSDDASSAVSASEREESSSGSSSAADDPDDESEEAEQKNDSEEGENDSESSAGKCVGTISACAETSWAFTDYPELEELLKLGEQDPLSDESLAAQELFEQWEEAQKDSCNLQVGCEVPGYCAETGKVENLCERRADESTCAAGGCEFETGCRTKAELAEPVSCADLTESECGDYADSGCVFGECSGSVTTNACGSTSVGSPCRDREDCYEVFSSGTSACTNLLNFPSTCGGGYNNPSLFDSEERRRTLCGTLGCDVGVSCFGELTPCGALNDTQCGERTDCEVGDVCVRPDCSKYGFSECGAFEDYCSFGGGEEQACAISEAERIACSDLTDAESCGTQAGCVWEK